MTVPIPTAIPTTSAWGLFDWLDRTFQSAPAAGGTATITLPQTADNERWQLTHMVAGCTSGAQTSMRLYLDGPANPNLRDGTASGNFDVADWPQGLWVPPSRALVAVWTGCDTGAVAYLTVQATILRRG